MDMIVDAHVYKEATVEKIVVNGEEQSGNVIGANQSKGVSKLQVTLEVDNTGDIPDTTFNPLYIANTDSNKTLVSAGEIFTVTKVNVSLLLDYSSIKINNPSSSGKTVFLSNFSISTTITGLNFEISFIKNGTHTSSNTITPINNNFTSSKTSSCTVTYSEDGGTGSDSVFNAIQFKDFYTQSLNSTISIPPNSSILIRFHVLDLLAGSMIFVLTFSEF